MANLTGLTGIVAELRTERANLVNQLRHVDAALSVLGKLDGGAAPTVSHSRVSAAARKKMSLAQKARWAKHAASNGDAKPKRVMSVAARRKIAAAQRARWAKVKAAAR
jgi:hypothetical protein